MSTQAIEDYLTKEIFINKNVVTFRSLSRAQEIHVNVAKNELAVYFEKARSREETVSATYLIAGELKSSGPAANEYDSDDEGDVPMNSQDSFGTGSEETVPQTKAIIARQEDIENVKSRFSRVTATHVYSLAPSPIRDGSLLCSRLREIRKGDFKKDTAYITSVGKVVGSHVKMRTGKAKKAVTPAAKAGPSKTKPEPPAAPAKAPAEKPKAVDKPKPAIEKPKTAADRMQSFFGKPKENKTAEKAEISKQKTVHKEDSKSDKKEVKAKDSSKASALETTKNGQGTKRKSTAAMLSESEDDEKPVPKPKTDNEKSKAESSKASSSKQVSSKPKRNGNAANLSESGEDTSSAHKRTSKAVKARVLKGRVVSSDEEEDSRPAPKGKPKRIIDEDDEELRAMMDVDDDQVTRVSRHEQSRPREQDRESSQEAVVGVDEDVEMEDVIPKTKTKRKAKKEIPRGKNGLKKRRVVKSRTFTDKNGYFVTEDYSEYESVEEEEESEAEQKPKKDQDKPSKGKTAKDTRTKPKPKTNAKPAPKTKKTTMDSYFAKPKGK